MTNPSGDRLVFPEEAAERLDVGVETIIRRVRNGMISALSMDGTLRFLDSEIVRCERIVYWNIPTSERKKRIRDGIENARARGVKFGPPEVPKDPERWCALRAAGHSWRDIAKEEGASLGTVFRAVKQYNAQQAEERARRPQEPTEETPRDRTCQKIPMREARAALKRVKKYLQDAREPWRSQGEESPTATLSADSTTRSNVI
jgi:transposase